jgi:pimeloyl-ACP methyl ester carboxylesterase
LPFHVILSEDNDMPMPLIRFLLTPLVLLTVLSGRVLLADDSAEAPFPGKVAQFHGFDEYGFDLDGIGCRVVVPKKVAGGKPWIWRARFFGHEPQTDIALLEKGFHVAYADVGGLYGSPAAVERWNKFYEYLTTEHGFAEKPALEGMSRGGLIIYNWAAANPNRVACIYGDAPVCDFKSWPGKSRAGNWQQVLKAYQFPSDEEAVAFTGNPIDNLKPLAKAGVPLLHVCGAADDVVPMSENTDVLAKRYRDLGGEITVIAKPGVGHHPHSLKDPKAIVDFVLKHTMGR